MPGFKIKPILEYLIEPGLGEKRVERFWSYVDRGKPDECWDWTGCRGGKGFYGQFGLTTGQIRRSNRVAWVIANQREPGNLLIRHTCDRPICCNPAHLVTGTHDDNMKDKILRGRSIASHVRKPNADKTRAELFQEVERLQNSLHSILAIASDAAAVTRMADVRCVAVDALRITKLAA